jgi:hypothetical protein
MDTDFFGYTRAKAGQYLYSSDYAAVYFGSQVASTTGAQISSGTGVKAGLTQGVSVAYQQTVQPRFEGGSSELFWVAGQSLGTIQVGRLIGQNGILDGINVNTNALQNGLLGSIDFKVGRMSGVPIVSVSAKQDVLVLKGCVFESYGAQFSTGGLDVSESMLIRAALIKRKTT